jgi:hypothetical protein
VEGKKTLMTGLLAPILEKFPVYLTELGRATVPSQQEEIAQALNHLLSFGRYSYWLISLFMFV